MQNFNLCIRVQAQQQNGLVIFLADFYIEKKNIFYLEQKKVLLQNLNFSIIINEFFILNL